MYLQPYSIYYLVIRRFVCQNIHTHTHIYVVTYICSHI